MPMICPYKFLIVGSSISPLLLSSWLPWDLPGGGQILQMIQNGKV